MSLTEVSERTEAVRLAPGPATLALMRVESYRLLRHPLTVVAFVLYLAPWAYAVAVGKSSERYPVLQNADRATQVGALFILGAAAFVGANLASLRPERFETVEQQEVMVLPAWRRTLAHLTSVVPLAIATAVFVGARMAVLATRPGAVGHANGWEVATGPLVVLFLGVAGVLLATWFRVVIVAPLVFAGLVLLTGVAVIPPLLGSSQLRWLLPVAFEDETLPSMPHLLLGRPAAAHVLYLAGLVALMGALALFRGGLRGPLALAVVVATALAVAGGTVLQLRPAPASVTAGREAATNHPVAEQVCRTRGVVSYCAFPDFVGSIPYWDDTVRGVLRRVPTAAVPAPLAVRQRVYLAGRVGNGLLPARPDTWAPDDAAAGTPVAIDVGTDWGPDGAAMVLAVATADRVVAGPQTNELMRVSCGAPAVLTLWLAGQSSPAALAGIRAAAKNGTGAVVVNAAGFGTGTIFRHPDVRAALALLAQPVDVVATEVTRSWPELVSTTTTPARAEQALQLTGQQVSTCR